VQGEGPQRVESPRAVALPIALITPALFDDEQAALYLGVGSRKFREMREAGLVPAPIVLGPRHLRWSRVELDAAIAAMPRQSSKPDEPTWLAQARSDRTKTSGAPA